MTRIVAGAFGGRRLAVPVGEETRPTSDRVREALFSTLESLIEIEGCRFADLYAGSGAVGLEAASRGAAHVLLVEAQARAARSIRANIATLGLGGVCRLLTAKVASVLAGPVPDGDAYDVIFADPPYGLPDEELATATAAIVGRGWLGTGGVLVLERSTRSGEPAAIEGITAERARRYGESTLWYFRRS
jgi:16S rRNA (guanine(966)-N(2))-methyltransferase RsmD